MHAGSGIETQYCTQQTGVLTRELPSRAIRASEAIAAGPGRMAPFLASLARDDLAPATLRG
jgi:hypothetical protein